MQPIFPSQSDMYDWIFDPLSTGNDDVAAESQLEDSEESNTLTNEISSMIVSEISRLQDENKALRAENERLKKEHRVTAKPTIQEKKDEPRINDWTRPQTVRDAFIASEIINRKYT